MSTYLLVNKYSRIVLQLDSPLSRPSVFSACIKLNFFLASTFERDGFKPSKQLINWLCDMSDTRNVQHIYIILFMKTKDDRSPLAV